MKAIIYNRVSTKEQNPELQKNDCINLCNNLKIYDYEYLQEKGSAWKESSKREVFEKIKQRIKSGEINILIVWDLDRLYRNRKKTIQFIKNYKAIGLKVYSVRQQWLEQLNNIPEPFDEAIADFMLQIVSWMAEEESNKKSERVKNAVVRIKGKPTKSYKGKRWGRKNMVENEKIINEVIELRDQGHSIREIADSVYYWDKNNNKKAISKSLVHKILMNLNTKPNVV